MNITECSYDRGGKGREQGEEKREREGEGGWVERKGKDEEGREK